MMMRVVAVGGLTPDVRSLWSPAGQRPPTGPLWPPPRGPGSLPRPPYCTQQQDTGITRHGIREDQRNHTVNTNKTA